MKNVLVWSGAAILMVALIACETTTPQRGQNRGSGNRFGASATPSTQTQYVVPESTPTPPPSADRTPESTPPPPSPTPTPLPASTGGSIPYGTPVPGKPGFVTSPHSPYSGYVDVRGYPPGQEVKDPYTGKIFLVP